MSNESYNVSDSGDVYIGDESSFSVHDSSRDFLYSSYLRSVNKRHIFFAEEIIGCTIDIHYPEDAGRFLCEVVEYSPRFGWHKVKSVNNKSVAINFESNSTEEDFTDEVDLNAFWRERRVQFVGKSDCPFLYCPLCKWQAAPAVACIKCLECGQLTHIRCAARASGFESFNMAEESMEEYTCASCCRMLSKSPQLTASLDPLRSALSSPTTSAAYDQMSVDWTDQVLSELNGEFWDLQSNGQRKFKFISGSDYLQNLCNGSSNHAMTALQHCSTAGVLSWVYEDGSESENCRIIKRGLDPTDSTVQLLVCIADLSPTNQPRMSSKPPSQAWCCHMTFGFVAMSGLLKTTRTKDVYRSLYGHILIFACRSSQVRSIDELHSVISERVWSNWTVLDNSDGQLIDTVEQVSTHCSLVYTVKSIPPPCKTPEEIYLLNPPPSRSGRRGMAPVPPAGVKDKSSRQVLNEIFVPGGVRTRNGQTYQNKEKVITRSDWDPTRFTLVHRGMNYETAYLPLLPTPSRLLFGASLRLFQKLGYRVVLLELALPISDEIRHHGQGREVEVVTSHGFSSLSKPVERADHVSDADWPAWMPRTGDMVLAPTTNAAAYKTYRAFGLAEHAVWNQIGCNASQNYKYPVLGCVLEQQNAGGLSKSDIERVALRQGAPLRGIESWIPSLKKRRKRTGHEPSVVSHLVEGTGFHPDDPDIKEWMDGLFVFETVLDFANPKKMGVSPEALSCGSPAKKQRRTSR